MAWYWWVVLIVGLFVVLLVAIAAITVVHLQRKTARECSCVSVDQAQGSGMAVVLVHGTFARHALWAQPNGEFAVALVEKLGDRGIDASVVRHCWSGGNSHLERIRAADSLRKRIQQLRLDGFHDVVVVAHSHGGNVAMFAAECREASATSADTDIDAIVSLATPFQVFNERPLERRHTFLMMMVLFGVGAVLVPFWIGATEWPWLVRPVNALMVTPAIVAFASLTRLLRSGGSIHVTEESDRTSDADGGRWARLRSAAEWIVAEREMLAARLNPRRFDGPLLVVSPVADEASMALVGAQVAGIAGTVMRSVLNWFFIASTVVFTGVLVVLGVLNPLWSWAQALQAANEDPEVPAPPIGEFFANGPLAGRGDDLGDYFAIAFWIFVGLAAVLFTIRAALRLVPGSEFLVWSERLLVYTQVAPPGRADILTIHTGSNVPAPGLRHSSVYTPNQAGAIADWIAQTGLPDGASGATAPPPSG